MSSCTFIQLYNLYRLQWEVHDYDPTDDRSEDVQFKEHINSLSLHEFMKILKLVEDVS